MERLHLIEIEDQPWCPRAVRDTLTDTLRLFLNLGHSYGPIVPHLRRALERTGARRVVDLCSGAGGPWPRISRELDAAGGGRVLVYLTDKYPNLEALAALCERSGGQIQFLPEPVDATRVPAALDGFRTLFTSFHHFRPENARAILLDALKSRQGIGIFELTSRRFMPFILMLLAPLAVLLAGPFLRPFRRDRLLWTYLLPLAPVAALFDGLVSCLRAYSPSELRELTRGLADDSYTWEIGEEQSRLAVPITYLIGYPRTRRAPSDPRS
ncbi:MAG: class I SAM-dependent methyltransferase [Gemmatimonadetes bacterium]|nr:class I SAM-dependent methyltransferase [Gemmatimonadota bacterium]